MLNITNNPTPVPDIPDATPESTTLFGGINRNMAAGTSRDYARAGAVATNLSPFGIIYDGEITQIVISANNGVDFQTGIYINNSLIRTINRNNNTRAEIVELTPPIPVRRNDELRVRFTALTNTVQRPTFQLTYTKL